jgi:hypothetical protein
MSLGKRKTKAEHSGAKNGGGHWGTRSEAKQILNRLLELKLVKRLGAGRTTRYQQERPR